MSQALIVAVVSKKGGVGKSTVDVNFAIKLALDGKRVCIIDLDNEQYTSARHLTRRDQAGISPKISFHATTYDKVDQLILSLSGQFDVIFIETAGEMTKQVKKAISIADMILTCLQPFASEFETIPLIEEVMSSLIKEGLALDKVPSLIIPNRVAFYQKPGLLNFNRDSNPLVALIKKEPELKYFKFTKNYIKDRPTLYGRAYELGKAIFELKGEEINPDNKKEGQKSIKKGSEELEKIYNEVFYGE
jgi:cellulose biosynthesis protein BcsQ